MGHVTRAELKDGLAFDVEVQGHSLQVDADPSVGGKNYGPTPKPLVLSALVGCTGMDVASILRKMQMPFDSFTVEASGEIADEHPKVYTSIHLRYIFTGENLDRSRIEKAVKLSQDKYCAVTAMLRKATELDYEIVLNQE